MRPRLAFFITSGLLFTITGCGTMFNCAGCEPWLMGQPPSRDIAPFGGVDNDIRWMKRFTDPNQYPQGECDPVPVAMIAPALDIPLSLAGDIITLPWTIYQAYFADQPRKHEQIASPNANGESQNR